MQRLPRLAHLPHRSVLELSGPDAQKFLKGLSCKDVDSIGGGYSGFLNASGRVLHTSFILPVAGRKQPTYLVTHESPDDHPAPLHTLLPPFKLRAKVKIRDVTEEWDAYSAWGDADDVRGKGKQPIRTWKLGSGGAAESQWSWDGDARGAELGEGEVGCWDLRAGWGGLGRQVLVSKGKKPSLSSSFDDAAVDEYHLRRMLLGVPEGPEEIVPGSALPLESCMDIHGGVDFRKGCYLGQELTVRTYHTGATRKRILPVRLIPLNQGGSLADFLPPSSPSTSASQTLASSPGPLEITYHPPESAASKKARSAGRILALQQGSIGLGLVRLEMAEKAWWSGDISTGSVQEWLESGVGRLTTQIGDTTFGVHVDKGEAYAEALRAEADRS
ncbi:hypothetical protein IAU60_000186 [Kwoniella sp. DSM 27419]